MTYGMALELAPHNITGELRGARAPSRATASIA